MIEFLDFRIERNTLKGFAKIRVPSLGKRRLS
jgi:hypothetical protein